MLNNVIFGLKEITRGVCDSVVDLKIGSTLNELSGRVSYEFFDEYLGLRVGEKISSQQKFELIRKALLAASLTSISFFASTQNLEHKCSILTNNPFCSFLSNTKVIFAIASGIILLRAIHNFKNRTTLKYSTSAFRGTIKGRGDDEVTIRKNGRLLEYKVASNTYHTRAAVYYRALYLGQLGCKDDQFATIKRSALALNRHFEPSFFKTEWNWKKYVISIRQNRFTDSLSVILFNRIHKTKMVGSTKNLSLGPRRSEELMRITPKYATYAALDEIKRNKHNIFHLNKFFVGDLKICNGSFQVFLIPNHCKSRIDNRVYISEFYWGVTLVSHEGICGNHAQVVIEGMDNGKYFMEVCEFNGPGNVKLFDLKEKELQYEKRSHIWKIELYTGRFLLRRVEDYEKMPPDKFSWLGRHSILGDGHDNCMTWAIELLRIAGIELEDSRIKCVATIVKFYLSSNDRLMQEEPNCREEWI